MSIGDFLGRVGDNIGNAPPEAWFSLAQALAGSRDPLQGLAQGLGGFGQQIAQGKKKASLAEALKGVSGGFTPDQQAFLGALEPDQAANIVGSNLFKAPTEKWEQVDSNGDGVPDRQRSTLSGKIDDIPLSLADRKALAAAGGSRVTVNNIPPEVGARIGLGEGFLRQFDDIKARAKKFYSGGPGGQVIRRGQMVFNTGEGGKLWADVESGKEALIRQLTGAGMATAEAENQASRYALSPYDTEFDALQKLDRLQRDLVNTATGAYGAKGGKYTAPGGGDVIKYDANGNRIQ